MGEAVEKPADPEVELWRVEVTVARLQGPAVEGQKTEYSVEAFGGSADDLAMLGAAKGYLEGLYREAELAAQKALGAQQQREFAGMAREIMERLAPPPPRLPFPFPVGAEEELDLTWRDLEILRLGEIIRTSQERLDELREGRKAGRA